MRRDPPTRIKAMFDDGTTINCSYIAEAMVWRSISWMACACIRLSGGRRVVSISNAFPAPARVGGALLALKTAGPALNFPAPQDPVTEVRAQRRPPRIDNPATHSRVTSLTGTSQPLDSIRTLHPAARLRRLNSATLAHFRLQWIWFLCSYTLAPPYFSDGSKSPSTATIGAGCWTRHSKNEYLHRTPIVAWFGLIYRSYISELASTRAAYFLYRGALLRASDIDCGVR
ncbi:hypothetical protein B0H11DRAFT_2194817 [Mycena galericulata]|nr:hypothetical protein B0H11DRAFT_2194817 [Mycena galericulata]